MSRVCVLGGRGFVGRAVVAALKASDVEPVVAPSVRSLAVDAIAGLLTGADVVVNAAGLAAPDSTDLDALREANAALPARLAQAAASVDVRRLVHVSTAGVQGARRILDESTDTSAFSPYTLTKAEGERALLKPGAVTPVETVVYRPPSVFGTTRSITSTLVSLYSQRFAPILGNGDQPIPAALVENVGRAIAHLAIGPTTPSLVLHPFEGMTQRLIAEAFRAPRTRLITVPVPPREASVKLARPITPSRIKPALRRIDLLAYGQRQDATHLGAAGFVLGDQFDRYSELARSMRAVDPLN